MEIEITALLEMDAFPLSHSRAEGGENAGPESWNSSMKQATETPLLDTPEKLRAFRDWVKPCGGWEDEEIDAWSDRECDALFLQWVAGDIREAPATLEGITFSAIETDGRAFWFYKDETEEGFEYGPFETRSEAYENYTRGVGNTADSLKEIDWPEYEAQASKGRISSNFFKGDNGKIYFSLYQ